MSPRLRTTWTGLWLATALALPPGAVRAEEVVAAAASAAAPVPAAEAGALAAPEAPAEPAQPKSRRQIEAERRQRHLSPRVSKTFGEVRGHLDAGRFAEAQEELGKLRQDKLSPVERAQANRLRGYAAYGEQHNDAAIEALQAALAEPDALPPADRADVLFQIAQIQAAERRWRDVIATLETWFQAAPRPNSVAYFLLALSHYQLEEVDAALLPAKKAVEIAQQPQQPWLQLLLAVHLTRKEYPAATSVLERLVSLYPNVGKDYWLQLSALYGITGDGERARGVLELAHTKGLLTQDRDLRRLLQLMLAGGLPYRAAQVFEKELADERLKGDSEALELLGISWILARDPARAEAPLSRAAELAAKGDLYVRLAQIHLMQEEWNEAVDALQKGLAKGGLGDPGTAQLLLGIAYYNEHNLREARSWFAHAQQSTATRQQAETWLEHIDRELGGGHASDDAAG